MTDATSRDGAGSRSTAQPVEGAKGPDELRRQIEQTRGQLGDTVEELAGKADVKGRAKARAADLKDKAGAMTVQLRSSAAHAGHAVQSRAGRGGQPVEDRTAGSRGATEWHPPRERRRGAVRAGLGRSRTVLVAGVTAGAVVAAGLVRRRRHGRR
ncbi:DUF3618 domain-containing protein [Streptomyces olivaceus]|uniref:DUF3618 domain-containing protein n=1 Tax=Streptomyces olivaceus TaxID=47716 RepID=UPI001CD00720|nr:DUF3618 domain-containing protein [Streptomyces olivaceus]MBZ6197766.1 DUF3618 domain-containing protein [Streptomyces olivaceus]